MASCKDNPYQQQASPGTQSRIACVRRLEWEALSAACLGPTASKLSAREQAVHDAEGKTKYSCREVRLSRSLTEGATRRLKAMHVDARLMTPEARVSPAGHGETHFASVGCRP